MAFKRTVRALSATALTGALILEVAPAASADQTRRDQWALEALQAESVWKVSTGKGVTVAVIDTGVNFDHIDLKNNLLKGHDFKDNDDDPSPESGAGKPSHGTSMASIIAGHGHGQGGEDGVKGLAPDAKILPIRSGIGYAAAIRYAVDQGASVINVSEFQTQDLPEDREAVTYALKHNVLIVSGSGNSGNNNIWYPAKYPGVLTVGGVDSNGEIWKDSNYGPEVLLTAPATDIVSAGWPGSDKLRIGSGTSDSTAYVSAAAALLRAKFPNLTAGQIANRLVKTAVVPESANGISLPDDKYGYGIINPLDALTKEIPAGSKYGPLKVSDSENSSGDPDAGNSDTNSTTENDKADQKQMLLFAALGVVSLVVIGLIILLIGKLSRRNKNNNSGRGGPSDPTAYPQYGQPVPPQQNPYQQPVPPQQNPYQHQPPPPHNQWPPQQ